MGDYAEDCFDREFNEFLEDTQPSQENPRLCCLICGKPIDRCTCSMHPNEDEYLNNRRIK